MDAAIATHEYLAQSPLVTKVEEALATIRPYLEADGGNVKMVGITPDHVVHLEMIGNCSTCPMSAMTLKAGVEEAIKKAVPEIQGILALNV